MNKEQFLFELRGRLAGLPLEDIEKSLDYYSEIVDDRIEEGMTEDQAVTAVGTPADAAAQILMEMPLPKVVKVTAKPKRKLSGAEIALLCITFPIWGSILISLIATVFSIYVSIWAGIISLFVTFVALIVGGGAMVLLGCPGFMILGRVGEGLFTAGAGFVLLAVGILGFMATKLVVKFVVWLTKQIAKGIKSLFVKRGEKV